MTFGENLKKYRENSKLSQQQIADDFGVDLATVMEWENNKTMPSAEKLIELSKFYNVYLE